MSKKKAKEFRFTLNGEEVVIDVGFWRQLSRWVKWLVAVTLYCLFRYLVKFDPEFNLDLFLNALLLGAIALFTVTMSVPPGKDVGDTNEQV